MNRVVSAGDTDGNVFSFSIGTKDFLQKIHAHSATISSLAYSANGEELITGSFDGIIRQWIPIQSAVCIRSILPSPKVAVPM
jgi:WD40 repeat protein